MNMPEQARRRIMVVEDEAVIAMDLQVHLEDYGYEVVAVAASGEDAVRLALERLPDLIVMDVVIKGPCDGIAAARKIRERHPVPVVFLTAYGDAATLERAKQACPYGYLLKPFRAEELRATVEVALVKHWLETRLRESEQWFAKTLHCLTDGIITTGTRGETRFLNPVAEQMTGWNQHDAAGRNITEILHLVADGTAQSVALAVFEALENRRVVTPSNALVARSRNGGEVYVDEGAAPIVDDHGALMGAVEVLRDVTARRRIEQALHESEDRFHGAFDHAAIGMALVALDGRILQVNRSFGELVGRSQAEVQQRRLLELVHPDDLDHELGQTSRLVGNAVHAIQIEVRLLHADGPAVWTQVSKSLVRNAHGAPLYFIVQLQDIQARKAADERMAELAQRDKVTGLPNHEQTRRMLEHALAAARRRGEPLALLRVDLDGFRQLVREQGETRGETLLRSSAETIAAIVRESDVVGRWGGDDFVVLLQNSPLHHAERVAHKVLDALAALPLPAGRRGSLSASIGVAEFPQHADGVAALLRAGDDALQRAREAGGGRVCPAHGEALRQGREQTYLEYGLRRALEAQELQLHYQPIYRDARVAAVEALLRWSRPGEGLVAPAAFLDTAERCGLLVPMGPWILGTACRQMAAWRRHGALQMRVAVNLSARQFRDPHLVEIVQRALEESELAADALELEITEAALMQDPAAVGATLGRLRDLGAELTVDDFGTGYSSVAHLRRLPIQRLKIDRSFVHDVPGDADAEALVQTMLGMARNLGLSVVAEGVETAEQLAWLQGHGCERMQGYGLHRPVPAESLRALD